MPHLKELYARYRDQGLVLIGVHTRSAGEKMAGYVEQSAIGYPVAVDRGSTTKRFMVDSYPDYYLIDRAGKLRVADLANGDLDRAVGVLLAEKAPGAGKKERPLAEQDAEEVLAAAVSAARASERKVLIHLGGPG